MESNLPFSGSDKVKKKLHIIKNVSIMKAVLIPILLAARGLFLVLKTF